MPETKAMRTCCFPPRNFKVDALPSQKMFSVPLESRYAWLAALSLSSLFVFKPWHSDKGHHGIVMSVHRVQSILPQRCQACLTRATHFTLWGWLLTQAGWELHGIVYCLKGCYGIIDIKGSLYYQNHKQSLGLLESRMYCTIVHTVSVTEQKVELFTMNMLAMLIE